MEKGKERLAAANVRAVSLTDFDEIVKVAEAGQAVVRQGACPHDLAHGRFVMRVTHSGGAVFQKASLEWISAFRITTFLQYWKE